MGRIKLSSHVIEHLEVKEKTYTVWDSEVRGFGVRVWASGSKVFTFKYEQRCKQHWITLGRFGELTYDQAKKKALKLRLQIADGQKPGEELQAKRKAPTVSDLCDRFLAEHADVKTKPSTAKEYRRTVERDIRPALGPLKVREVTTQDIHALHHKLSTAPIQANRTLAVMSKMFSLAELWGMRVQNTNPCFLIQRMPEKRRERFLSERELKHLGDVFQAMEAAGEIDLFASAALRMLILTGARLGEITGLQWSMVDLENGFLRLPDSKTGAKVVFLNPPAIAVLMSLPEILGNPHVFPGEAEGQPITNLSKAWDRVKAKAKLPGVRIHDLRHTFASMAARSGLSLQIVGALLGHAHPSTTKRYTHFASRPLLEGSEQVGKVLGGFLKIDTPEDENPEAETAKG